MSGRRVWRQCAWLLLLGWMAIGTPLAAQEATPTPGATSPATPDLAARDFGPVQGKETFRLAFLNPYPDHAFWQAVQAAVQERAAADAVIVDVFALTSSSAPEQIAQMAEVIEQRYDGILLGAVDPVGVIPGIVAANQAGIPVIAIDTNPAGGRIVSLVQIDNVAAAHTAGKFIAETIGREGTVLNLQGSMTADVAKDRDQGVRAALDAFPAIDVVSERADWNREVAAGLVSLRLPASAAGTPTARDRRPRAIFGANDAMALGALDAVKASGQDDIVIVGFGGTPEALAAIAAGDLTATIAQFPTRVGAIGVDMMVRHLNGEAVEPRVDPGFAVVTARNVDQFAT